MRVFSVYEYIWYVRDKKKKEKTLQHQKKKLKENLNRIGCVYFVYSINNGQEVN